MLYVIRGRYSCSIHVLNKALEKSVFEQAAYESGPLRNDHRCHGWPSETFKNPFHWDNMRLADSVESVS